MPINGHADVRSHLANEQQLHITGSENPAKAAPTLPSPTGVRAKVYPARPAHAALRPSLTKGGLPTVRKASEVPIAGGLGGHGRTAWVGISHYIDGIRGYLVQNLKRSPRLQEEHEQEDNLEDLEVARRQDVQEKRQEKQRRLQYLSVDFAKRPADADEITCHHQNLDATTRIP